METLFHRSIAWSGLNSLISAKFRLIRIKSERASSAKQFLQSVFTNENPLSHSDECAGIDRSRSTSIRKCGAISLKAMLSCSQSSSFPIFLPPNLNDKI